MKSINRSARKAVEASNSNIVHQEHNCYEGERLAGLLKSIEREIELAKLSNRALPEKIWFKQQFSIGVNDVTRVLERMGGFAQHLKASPVQLQAILLAWDCNPRWLTKHLPTLASLRKVPVIFVKDKKGGSLRLGELVHLKTAIAIGIKARGNGINQAIEEILRGHEEHA